MTEYELVRSRRKTLSVQVTRECRVIVRAPLRLAKREIDRFVSEHADWIARALAHQRTLAEAHPEPDEAQARALAERAVREREPDFSVERISEDDAETFALISRGDTGGVFQLESAGMRRMLMEMKP